MKNLVPSPQPHAHTSGPGLMERMGFPEKNEMSVIIQISIIGSIPILLVGFVLLFHICSNRFFGLFSTHKDEELGDVELGEIRDSSSSSSSSSCDSSSEDA